MLITNSPSALFRRSSSALDRRRPRAQAAPWTWSRQQTSKRARVDAAPTAARAFVGDDGEPADAALARRRALFLLDAGADAGAQSGSRNAGGPPPPLRIWRVGVDEPRLLKALEGAGFAGRVVVSTSLAAADGGCDAVLAVARKPGQTRAVDLSAARAAAKNARAEFVLLRATSARAVFDALAPILARREASSSGDGRGGRARGDDDGEDDEAAAAAAERFAAAAAEAVERLRRAAPALANMAAARRRGEGWEQEPEEEYGGGGLSDAGQGFTRVPTLRAVAAAAAGASRAGQRASSPPSSPSSASSAAAASAAASASRLLDLLSWSEGVAAALRPRALSAGPAGSDARRRPLLTPPRAARLPEPAWLWLGTAGAAADDGGAGGDGGGEGGGGGVGGGDGRAALVPRNRDARSDAAFRVSRDDGGPLQPGAPGDAKRRRQAAEERDRRRRGGGGGDSAARRSG